MQEIKVEFLRRGPAHNQLLSPLTDYLLLCGNRRAQPLNINFEHREFLEHLAALRYDGGEQANGDRSDSLDRVRDLVSGITNDIHGLEKAAEDGEWLHVRLVLGPSELSLLPFELSKCPDGFPGDELPLVLNARRPTVLTREIRQPETRPRRWPAMPRVLVAYTNLPGADVPYKANLGAIWQAIRPWASPGSADPRSSDLWTVIENASLEKINAACKKDRYTHVHLLAHGAELPVGKGRGHGVALHDPSGKGVEVVAGKDLAAALCHPDSCGQPQLPAAVVLASCDSDAGPDVAYTGASTAQTLHAAGIPFVVASHYPLSKVGSAIMAKELYPLLFGCEDPRIALYRVRQELHSSSRATHDWASIVAYSALPEALETQLQEGRLKQCLGLTKAAKDWLETGNEDEAMQRLRLAMSSLQDVAGQVQSASESVRNDYTEACGRIGSEHEHRARQAWNERGLDDVEAWKSLLRTAREWYHMGHEDDVLTGSWTVPHWTATQFLCLSAVLDGHLVGKDSLWLRARADAQAELYAQDAIDQLWAMGSLAELWMLRPLTSPSPPADHWETSRERSKQHVGDLLEYAASRSRPIQVTRDHFQSYVDWWGKQPKSSEFEQVSETAKSLVAIIDAHQTKGPARAD